MKVSTEINEMTGNSIVPSKDLITNRIINETSEERKFDYYGALSTNFPTNIKEAIMRRLRIPQDSKIIFEDGIDVDLSTLEKSLHIPRLRTFKYVKYFKPESKRWT